MDWQKEYKIIPQIPGYKYYMGDIQWGTLIYVSKEDTLGLESEIQLYFDKNFLVKARLILGPEGMNEYNCAKKYKKIVSLLEEKYGDFRYVRETKDPMIDDLVSSSACYPIKVGLQEVETFWNHDKFLIKCKLIGDFEGFYIETTYINNNKIKNFNKNQKKKIIKKL